MNRIGLTDSKGEWFDADKATIFKEKTFHDGRNFVSKATDEAYMHQWLLITAQNKFVLDSYSDFGGRQTFILINKEEAASWFTKQGFSNDEIPEVFHEEVSKTEIM